VKLPVPRRLKQDITYLIKEQKINKKGEIELLELRSFPYRVDRGHSGWTRNFKRGKDPKSRIVLGYGQGEYHFVRKKGG